MTKGTWNKNVRGSGKCRPVMFRRVQKRGGGYFIRLPKPWCEKRGFIQGLKMALYLNRNEIFIRPVEEE